MTSTTTTPSFALAPSLETAWQDVDSSFERFCLTAGIGAIEQMLCEDVQQLAGAPHNRGGGRVGHRWGRTKGKIGFHGGKVAAFRVDEWPPVGVPLDPGHHGERHVEHVALGAQGAVRVADVLGRPQVRTAASEHHKLPL